MVLRKIFISMAMTVVLGFAANPAHAQYPSWAESPFGSGTPEMNAISAEGSVILKRQPSAIRVTVQLSAKGKTAEEAIAKLKERREAASAQAEKLKVDKKDVKFGNSTISNVQTNRQQQMERMVAQRRSQGKKTPKGLKAPETVAIACYMTLEWPLAGKTPDEIVLETQTLKQKVKAAEFSGKKEAEKLSPEEEELAAELAEEANNQGEDAAAEGEPQYLFVARITEEERQHALAEAFSKARKKAAELAKAAGIELGPLSGLSGGGGGAKNIGEETYGVYASSSYQRLQRMQQFAVDPDQANNETVATDPGSLEFTVTINALFKMGK